MKHRKDRGVHSGRPFLVLKPQLGMPPDETAKQIKLEFDTRFEDCNHFTATVDTVREDFHDLLLDVTKIVPGACP